MRRLLIALTALVLLPCASAQAEVLEELAIPTRDGATIHVEIARPDGDAKVPIVLTYSPYNSLGATPASNLASGDPWVEKGYARAYADVVGTRNSTGCWDYGGPVEQRSGVDLVGALAQQPWSNGKVGMAGVSYEGTTATMVAAAGDVPGLAAIVPVAAISRWYGYAFQDGVRYAGNTEHPTDEGFDTPLAFDLGFGRTPPDRPAAAQAILDRIRPCDADTHLRRGYEVDPAYDGFWLERDYRKDAARIRVPAFVVHGWQDYNVKQSEGTDLYEAIPVDDPATARLEGAPFKLAHFHQAPHADGAGDSYDDRLERFFARTLLGEANGIEFEPAVRTQTRAGRRDGGFERTTAWPPPGTRTTALALGEEGALGTQAAADPFTFTDAGTSSEEATLEGAPGALRFQTEPLAEALRLAGAATLKLRLSVTTTDGQLSPTLVDIAPDGSATPITRGHLNLRFRDGLAEPRPVPPFETVTATVRFAPQDQTVEAGHAIGLIVAGSNVAWALPVPGERLFTVEPAGSALELPVVGPAPSTPGTLAPATTGQRPGQRLTALLRRIRGARGGRVRVRGRAPAGSLLTVRVRSGRRAVGVKRLGVARSGRYRTAVRVRPRARRVRAFVVARQVGGARLAARSDALRIR